MSRDGSAAVSAGERLRADMDEALSRASRELGQPADQPLEWTEQELFALEAACSAADRADVMKAAFEAEQSGEARPSVMVKLSSELRALERQVVELLTKINPGLGPGVSERHRKASRVRWGGRADGQGGGREGGAGWRGL